MTSLKKKNRLALATAHYNAANTPVEKRVASAEHQIANAELYGMPDEDTFYALLAQKLDKIDTRTLSTEDRQQYDELKQMLGELPTDIKPLYAPKQETIDRIFLSGKIDPQNPDQEYLSYEMKTGAMEK